MCKLFVLMTWSWAEDMGKTIKWVYQSISCSIPARISNLRMPCGWRELDGLWEKLRGTFPVSPAHDLLCWVTVKKDNGRGRLIYPRWHWVPPVEERERHRCVGCKWVCVKRHELISAFGFEVGGKLPLCIGWFPFWTGGNWLAGILWSGGGHLCFSHCGILDLSKSHIWENSWTAF
jgi:hypothetical protein